MQEMVHQSAAHITLEGIALGADPNYGIIMEAYPFVARKLLRDDRPGMQQALQEVLYSRNGGDSGDSTRMDARRLSVLLNSALGIVAKQGAFVDLDALPEDAA